MSEQNQGTKHVSQRPTLSGQDKMFRIGGSTVGGIVVGGAIGGTMGPVGSGVGAVVGGVLGLAVSVSDSMKSGKNEK